MEPLHELGRRLPAGLQHREAARHRPRLAREDPRQQGVEIRAGAHAVSAISWRAMTSRWISLVPSPIVQIFASRKNFSAR